MHGNEYQKIYWSVFFWVMMPCRSADEHPLLMEPTASILQITILKMGTEGCSETLVFINKTTHHHIAEVSNLSSHYPKNFISQWTNFFLNTNYLDRGGRAGEYTNGLGAHIIRSRDFSELLSLACLIFWQITEWWSQNR